MGPKILTVDDSKTIRMIVARAFKRFECEVFEAADGVEGLTVAQRERPDIIILDLTMPLMDGVEMLTRLKADPDLRAIPVVMLTAEAGRENVLRIAKMGVRDYVVKPFKDEMIVERVGRLIDLKAKGGTAAQIKRFDDPLQILVVDDKPAIIEQIQAGLAGTAWTVHGVGQAGHAMDWCTENLPDIALVSLSLRENSGFMLYQMFRSSARTKSLPILALSVKTATDEQARAQQLGFGSIITKPIDLNDLQIKIARALSLDTSYKYFQRRDGALILTLPATFDQPVANDISQQLGKEMSGAVDSGLNRLVIDMSRLPTANLIMIKLGLSAIQLCSELEMDHTLIGSEAISHECKNYEETKHWQFSSSVDEALAGLKAKAAAAA